MVRRLAFLLMLAATVALARDAGPPASSVLPAPDELFDGLRSPWELDVAHSAYRSEEDSRAENPHLLDAARRDLVRLRQMGDAEWTRLTRTLSVAGRDPSVVAGARAALLGAPSSSAPLRHAVWTAVARGSGRNAAIEAMESLLADVVDAECTGYVLPTDVGVDETWRIGVQIYDEAAIGRRWRDIDVQEADLDSAIPIWRRVAERDIALWADGAAREIESQLLIEYMDPRPDRDRIRARLARLAELSSARTTISAWRIDAGDGAHAVVLRSRWPRAPEKVQILAQVRVGAAVFDVSCAATGEAGERADRQVERVLGVLAERARPFRLAD